MEIIKQDSKIFTIPLQDSNNDPITNLAECSEIVFVLKKEQSDIEPVIKITKTGGGIEVNNPVVGSVKLNITAIDSNIEVGSYYIALKLIYSATNKITISLSENNKKIERFKILQNTITD